jgi:uncharacterized protein YggE
MMLEKEQIMKKLSSIIPYILVIIILSGFSLPARAAEKVQGATPTAPLPTEAAELTCDNGRSVQVSGTAVVNVTPDRVLIQLGVQSNGSTPQKAESLNSATINRVTKALKSQGIDEKDIVTDWYVIEPVYESYDSLHIKGYRINNMVAITLRDIRKANKVITVALEAGANQVLKVEFYLSDLRTYRDQARALAMKAAKEKARDLASAAGARTGCVMNINENTWSYYNGGWWGYGTGTSSSSNLWTQNAVQNAAPVGGGEAPLDEDGPVNLGQIAVKAEVSAVFSLE